MHSSFCALVYFDVWACLIPTGWGDAGLFIHKMRYKMVRACYENKSSIVCMYITCVSNAKVEGVLWGCGLFTDSLYCALENVFSFSFFSKEWLNWIKMTFFCVWIFICTTLFKWIFYTRVYPTVASVASGKESFPV